MISISMNCPATSFSTFKDVVRQSGIAAWSMAAGKCDHNGDLRFPREPTNGVIPTSAFAMQRYDFVTN